MKRFFRIVAIGTALGLVLVAVQHALRMETDDFLRGYWTGAAAVLGLAVVCNICYNLRYRKKLIKALPLLEQGKPDEYITAVEGLLRSAMGRQLKNLLRLNLTAGYCDTKEFQKAIDLLEQLETERLPKAARMVQRLNLCLCYFSTGQGDRAMQVYDTSERLFAPYRGGSSYGKNLAVLDMLADLQKGDYDGARQLLETARKTWDDPRLAGYYDFIEKQLTEKAGSR